jgi:hypothetical protein
MTPDRQKEFIKLIIPGLTALFGRKGAKRLKNSRQRKKRRAAAHIQNEQT